MYRRNVVWIVAVVLMTAAFGVGLSFASDGETPGEESVCEVLQDPAYTKGLYGLCVAFCEAHDGSAPASQKILDKYEERRQEGDPYMPCLSEGGCQCFDGETLASIPPAPAGGSYSNFYSGCDVLDDSTNSIVSFNTSVLPPGFEPFVGSVAVWLNGSDNSKCRYEKNGIRTELTISYEEALVCRDLIVEAQNTPPWTCF